MIQLFVRFYRFSLYLLFIYSFIHLLMPWARLRNHKANYNNPKEVSVCIFNQLLQYHTTPGPNLPHFFYTIISVQEIEDTYEMYINIQTIHMWMFTINQRKEQTSNHSNLNWFNFILFETKQFNLERMQIT